MGEPMSDERVFFSHTVPAMFIDAFPPEKYPGLEERYRALGLDVKRKLLPAYEYSVWRACLQAQRELVFPGAPVAEAAFQQGARYVDAYFDRTALGGPLLLVLRLIGVRRTLERMTHNFRSANNFSDTSVTVLSPSSAKLEVNDIFADSPEYMHGILVQGLARAGSQVTMKTLRHDGDAADFLVEWK